MSSKKKTGVTRKKRAKEIKNRYSSTTDNRFGRLFAHEIIWEELRYYHECSERFTVADTEKLIGLACELELDQCYDFDKEFAYTCAPLHAMNALLLLVSSDRSIADTVAQRMARRCADTISSIEYEFVTVVDHSMIMLLCECGPVAIPYLIMEMRRLLLTPNLSEDSWLGASYISAAIRGIILECYKDIPLAISLTDQFCVPLLEYGKHPTATRNPVNFENATHFTSIAIELAILVTEEKEVLELLRSKKAYYGAWIDVLRSFSLEPHPQDEKLRERGNRMDWVIQTWNENHPDKRYPFPPGVVDGPFPGQPGYELPKRLFRHKYCTGSYKCRYESTSIVNTQNLKVCERCEHTYYCCEACQREDWCSPQGCGDRFVLKFYFDKFQVHPLKRLTPYYKTKSHRRQCLLIQSYKQWVLIDKVERKAGKDEDQHLKAES